MHVQVIAMAQRQRSLALAERHLTVLMEYYSCCSDNATAVGLEAGQYSVTVTDVKRLRSGGDRRYNRANGFGISEHLSGQM